MTTKNHVILTLALLLAAVPANASSLVYIVNGFQFGTVDASTGAFQQIGPDSPEGLFGLVAGPNGKLLAMTYSGNLDAIDPASGVTTLVGATGLADCATPASPCGPTSANSVGVLDGQFYATDFQHDLYRVDPFTGATTLIGLTGIPAIPFIPGSTNSDGTFNFYDETILGFNGALYVTFDAFIFDFNTFAAVPVISAKLYRVDPVSGVATVVGDTDLQIGGTANVGGTIYTFNLTSSQIATLELATGATTVVGNFDPAAGVIQGATAVTPEPGSIGSGLLGAVAMTMIARARRRRIYN